MTEGMTEVAFHTGVDDPVGYACRLLRKAWRSGARVAVYGPPGLLARLDQSLWSFEPMEFIPHLSLPRDGVSPDVLSRTPILLMRDRALRPGNSVTVAVGLGLGEDDALDLQGFKRVIDVVSDDPYDKATARKRWRAYEQAGAQPQHLAPGKPARPAADLPGD